MKKLLPITFLSLSLLGCQSAPQEVVRDSDKTVVEDSKKTVMEDSEKAVVEDSKKTVVKDSLKEQKFKVLPDGSFNFTAKDIQEILDQDIEEPYVLKESPDGDTVFDYTSDIGSVGISVKSDEDGYAENLSISYYANQPESVDEIRNFWDNAVEDLLSYFVDTTGLQTLLDEAENDFTVATVNDISISVSFMLDGQLGTVMVSASNDSPSSED